MITLTFTNSINLIVLCSFYNYLVDPLSRPSMVMATPQATSVLLTWSQSSTDVVDSYTISYMRTAGCSGAPSGSRTSISGSVRSYDLTDLEEHITYDITITAINTATQMSTTTPVTTLTAGERYCHLLTPSMHAREGYSSHFVCRSVVEHGISKMADFYPLTDIVSKTKSF